MTIEQTATARSLKDFAAGAAFIITDAEECDLSHVDATPTVVDSDGNPLQPIGLYVGTAGDLIVDMLGGNTVTFPNMPVGYYAIAVTRVYKDSVADDVLFLYGSRVAVPGALR